MAASEPIGSVLVVGGGSAGWLSAAYLQRAMPGARVTLIESSDVPRIGVGEATIPTLRSTMNFIGLPESEWMRACNATFKSAILFRDWRVGPSSGAADEFYHPFFPRPEPLIEPYGASHCLAPGDGFTSVQYWMRDAAEGRAARFDHCASTIPALCDQMRFAPSLKAGDTPLRYAYHMDAGMLAGFLREVCKQRGVHHVVDHVTHVNLSSDGAISSVETRAEGSFSADLYIDCSGFRSVLLGDALGETLLSDQQYLPCDSALAVQVPTSPEQGVRPYTIAQALGAGWSWNIPLYHRLGAGYVYCSEFITADEAGDELRQLLGDTTGKLDLNQIRMRVGRRERPWVKNCVGIGLSTMFLEPLESTSIFFTEYQLSSLVSLLPDRSFPAALRDRYNEMVGEIYEQVRDFIVLHYCTTQRQDSAFWRTVRNELPIPSTLQATLEAYRAGIPPADYRRLNVFAAQNWASILSGMRVFPERALPILQHADSSAARKRFAQVRSQAAALCKSTPLHHEYLRKLHGEAGAALDVGLTG